RRLRCALPLVVGAALFLGACGGDDDTTAPDTSPDTTVVDSPADPTDVGDAAGSEPAQACGLLDATMVDAALGTSGVTTSVDTSLGLFDGCRWATARTDVPAVVLGYGPTMDFDQVRGLACDGTTPAPLPAAGADAVACFGAVVAPAGSGVILVSIDDPADQWDDEGELALAVGLAITATGSAA
ncbi:MAG: hypothetical protein HZB15_02485, partial [Actinobacteria bacterium]|nr:hypothetical protein [Actinomycetota bacterium]